MSKWTKTSGLLFLAAASVYPVGAIAANGDASGKYDGGADVKLVADAPTTQPVEPAIVDKSAPAAPKVVLNDSGTFSIQINNDVNLVEVLRMIGNQAQVSIIPSKDVRGTVPAMDLYNVTVHDALDAILQSNGMGYRQKGNFIYVYSQKELADLDKAARVMNTEVFHLYYTPAANAVNMIKPVLSADAQVSFSTPAASGLTTGVGDSGGDTHAIEDMIVITDDAEHIEKARKIIKEIDRRPQQILVEATILRATLNENNALGIDFTVLGGTDFTTLMNPAGAATNAGTALTGNILNSTTAGPLLNKGFSGGSTSFSTQVPPGGLKIGLVQNNLALFLQALESITDTTILANPKILALDKQKGEVIVGRQDGYLTTTTTQTASTQTVEFLETGTRLVFRPYIGDDGYIRMEIHPEDSSGGLTSTNLPFKVTTEITSNVMVKDGNTIVIGGLFRESSQVSKAQVPFLGNIPLVGALFRQQQDSTTREEVIILLTPHIIKDDAAYSKASEEEMKELDKLRVGVRREMMSFGRERLAESSYESAVAEMKRPDPDVHLALWHLNCATNLNPLFIEAIDMKEKLTGQTITDVDNCTVRTFVRRQIMAERAAGPTTAPSTPLPPTHTGFEASNETAPAPVAKVAPTTQPEQAAIPATPPATAKTDEPTNEVRVIDDPMQWLTWPATMPSTRPDADDEKTTSAPMEPLSPAVPPGQ